MVVDDSPDARDVLRQIIEARGNSVIEARDGQEGLELAHKHKPDAIISDGLMPVMDGFQFLRAVKQDEILRAVPFVFYTAIYTGDKDLELAFSLGADALIVKPVDPETFWKEFSSAIEKRSRKKTPDAPGDMIERNEDYLSNYCNVVAASLETKVHDLENVIAEHNRTSAALAESEERYRLLFESNPHPMWVFDLETLAFLAVNDAAIVKYGYSREEFLSMTIKDIRPPEDVPALLNKIARVSEGIDEAGTWRHRKKSGTIIDVEITSHTLIFAGKKAELVMALDVTEQRRLDLLIKNAANEWRSTFDAINEPIALLDNSGSILRCNKAMAKLAQKKLHELLGKPCREIIHGAAGPVADSPLEQMKKTGKRETLVSPLGERWYEVTADPFFDDRGNITGAVHLMVDVTERKMAEDAILGQKLFTESLIQNSAIATFVLDARHKVLIWNKACEELTGVPASEMIGTDLPWKPFYHQQRPVLADIVLSDDREKLARLYPQFSKSVLMPEGLHAEAWLPALNGRDRYVVFDASPIHDSSGKIIAAIETLQDFSARKGMEDQIERARVEWEETFNTITDMVTVHDKDFNIIRANKAAEKILGLSFLEPNKTKCFEYYHGTGCPPTGCPSCQSLETGQPSTSELFEPHLNMFIEIRAIPRFDSDGKIAGLIHVVRDITERKKAEEALERYGKQLTALNIASNKLMATMTLADIYQQICDIISSVFDFKMVWLGLVEKGHYAVKPVAHTGQEDGYLSDIEVTWDDSPLGQGPTGTAIKTGKPAISTMDAPAFAPWSKEAGKRGYAASLAVPLTSSKGECLGALNFYGAADSFASDIIRLTQIFGNQAAIAIENARLVEELEEKVLDRTKALEDANTELQTINKEIELRREEADAASKSKTDFLANMSHELRTPLNAILGFADIMLQGMAGPVSDKQTEFLNDIAASGSHLLALITDILDLSKIEAGKTELELGEFSVQELIASSLIMFKEKALKHSIRVETDVDEAITNITADHRKLKQVMVNLLSNAFKFTPEGGSVSVRARLSAECGVRNAELKEINHSELLTPNSELHGKLIEISVTDTGIGISLENQKKLFQPFQQVETSLTRKYSGTGLGLSLCRRFVELHGGSIHVESESGKGSTFIFTIPMRR